MKNSLSLSEMMVLAERIRGLEHRVRTNEEVSNLLEKLNTYQRIFGVRPGYKLSWFRACKLGDRDELTNLYRLIYPPDPPIAAGRANLKGQTVFYAASSKGVACDEIESEAGDRIGVIVVRQRPDKVKPLAIVGEVEAIVNSGNSVFGVCQNEAEMAKFFSDDPEDLAKAHFADSVMAQLFRRTEKQYQATSLFADHLYTAGNGLVFPSVRSQRGVNIALLADHFNTHYEVVLAEELTVTQYHGHSQYSYESRGASCTFAPDGAIDWSPDQGIPATRLMNGGLNVSGSFVGWRVPVE